MRSSPLSVAATGVELAVGDAAASGEGEGDSAGLADGEGDVPAASSWKVAHGRGSTLAQSLCWPGGSPENGLTCVTKLPLPSAAAPPATLFGWSQNRVICSLERNAPPLTVICVVGPPSVTSRERNAFWGIGLALGDGDADGDGEGDGEGDAGAEGDGGGDAVGEGPVAAVRRNRRSQKGIATRTRRKRMKPGNDTRAGSVTPGARGSTTPRSAPGSASQGRSRRGACA